jgi:hypothetical protein
MGITADSNNANRGPSSMTYEDLGLLPSQPDDQIIEIEAKYNGLPLDQNTLQ